MTAPHGLCYLAHPYGGDPVRLYGAKLWLRACQDAFPGYAFIAPWIIDCEIFAETSENRGRGLRNDCEVVKRCDYYVMVGGYVSVGMGAERLAALEFGKKIHDWTSLGAVPPDVLRLRELVTL